MDPMGFTVQTRPFDILIDLRPAYESYESLPSSQTHFYLTQGNPLIKQRQHTTTIQQLDLPPT